MPTYVSVATALMTAVFLFAGMTKLVVPRERLARAPGGGWVLDYSDGFVRLLGAAEVLGAIGLALLPRLDLHPVAVALPAVGLAVIMTGAVTVEVRRGEYSHAALNVIYLSLLVVVAWGRASTGSVA